MADDDKLGNTGAANGSGEATPGILTAEQQDAVAALAATNKYAKQSKWKTFRELPAKDKWPFFVQHFLLIVVGAVIAVAMVLSLVLSVALKAPDPELAIVGFGMDDYAAQLDELKEAFVKEAKIDDDRLVDIDGSYRLGGDTSNMYEDDSAKIMVRVTAGDINMMIVDRDSMPTLMQRGYVSPIKDAEGKDAQAALAASGALVDKNGETTDDVSKAQGLDLSKSATWTGIDGLPDDAILVFSNIVDDTHAERAREFVDYLKFE
ncbi:hypothetical protein [Bifidobacterium aerophilum]|uniref:Uncharacterized protein n=1 Tax=Bifidobacterium aerophilum TaxID=1798155 RepID=A0A6N9Z2T9_9BIFI|nr:hypothetical protein [Bifidobacterium aerophilum]NEG88811.1 hypothetical protein [Bifidobacterium aerophilum]